MEEITYNFVRLPPPISSPLRSFVVPGHRNPCSTLRCLHRSPTLLNPCSPCLVAAISSSSSPWYKIIHRAGGALYLFRGRNYNYRTRPEYPMMLWKPATPVYPKLIQPAPEGLTKQEADDLRKKGKTLKPICRLAKNGIYISLVNDVRHAFEGSILVKIDCRGLEPSDYKKVGAKLKELVPCVLLSFDDEQILIWRGHNWKYIYPVAPPTLPIPSTATEVGLSDSGLYTRVTREIDRISRELVPCVLLSFDDEQILMWRGHDWKSIYPVAPPTLPIPSTATEVGLSDSVCINRI